VVPSKGFRDAAPDYRYRFTHLCGFKLCRNIHSTRLLSDLFSVGWAAASREAYVTNGKRGWPVLGAPFALSWLFIRMELIEYAGLGSCGSIPSTSPPLVDLRGMNCENWTVRRRLIERHGLRRGMNTSALLTSARATKVTVSTCDLTVHLKDGRTISAPLAWFPRILKATPEQRANFELIGDGHGIHWPEIDEDLSVAGLLRGVRAPT
jgi:hypothetical protein